MKRSILLFRFLLIFTIGSNVLSCGASSNSPVVNNSPWSWLGANGGTYWYVPTANLQAITWDSSDPTAYSSIDDQTVWHIESFDNGYIFGPVVAKFTGYDKNCQYLIGSVTPDGTVYISFTAVQAIPIGNPLITTGLGNMVLQNGAYTFNMQMASGSSSTQVSHTAFMMQCSPTQSCWNSLPEIDQSIPDFLGLCGFQ